MLQRCEKIVQGAVQSAFPDSKEKVVFYPTVSLQWGEIASDVCVPLAGRYKLPPKQIAEIILSALSEPLPGEVNFVHDELVVRLSTLRLSDSPYGKEEGEATIDRLDSRILATKNFPATVLLLPPSTTVPRLGFSRLLATTLLQLTLLAKIGAKCSLLIGREEVLRGEDADGAVEFFLKWLQGKALNQAVSYEELLELIDGRKGQQRSVWLMHGAFSRREISALYHSKVEGDPTARLCHPPQGWMEGVEEEFSQIESAKMGERETEALLWLLASPLPGRQLDLTTAFLGERGNLLWWAESTANRIGALVDLSRQNDINKSEESLRSAADELTPILRHALARLMFLPGFIQRAAYFGRIGEFITVFDDLLAAFARFFNDPNVRRRCDGGELTPTEVELTTGVWRHISAMMGGRECFLNQSWLERQEGT